MTQQPYTPTPPENDTDYEFLERVAIMRFDAGMSEQDAWNEALAIYMSNKNG